MIVKSNGNGRLYGLVDKQGRWIVEPKYKSIDTTAKAKIAVCRTSIGTDDVVGPTGVLGTFKSGRRLGNDKAKMSDSHGVDCVLDSTGNYIVSPKSGYRYLRDLDNGCFVVSERQYGEGLMGLLGPDGKVIIPQVYRRIYQVQEDPELVEVVSDDNKHGIINTKGVVVLPCEYSWLGFSYNGVVAV